MPKLCSNEKGPVFLTHSVHSVNVKYWLQIDVDAPQSAKSFINYLFYHIYFTFYDNNCIQIMINYSVDRM